MADGASSITKSLRTTKVYTGYAQNAYSDVRQNPANANCPIRQCVDDYGREADCHTVNTFSESCPFDPSSRMDIEANHRPSYYTTLNADGIRGDYTDGDLQFGSDQTFRNSANHGGYDTMGVRRDEAFDLNSRLQAPTQTWGDDQDFMRNQQIYKTMMQRRFQSQRFKAAGR